MKAQDLRVDNWINVLNPNTNEWKYERIKGKTIMNFQENPTHKLILNNFKPIELTKEILLKCGFEIKEYKNIYPKKRFKKDGYNLYFTNQEKFTGYVMCEGEGVIKGIHYLHQLQNLYFALTNEELTINL